MIAMYHDVRPISASDLMMDIQLDFILDRSSTEDCCLLLPLAGGSKFL
jgi:hypothetical protein